MNGTETTPLRFCAVCQVHYVREPTHYVGPCCADPGLKVTALITPVKTGTPVSGTVWPWSGGHA